MYSITVNFICIHLTKRDWWKKNKMTINYEINKYIVINSFTEKELTIQGIVY